MKKCLMALSLAWLAASPTSASPQANEAITEPLRPAIEPVIGGLLGGGLGLVGGVFLGASAACGECEGLEALGGAIVGGLIGETLLMGIGVHIANGGDGNLALTLGASTLGAAGALGIAAAAGDGNLVWLGAIGQLALTVMVERGTARRRAAQRRIAISVRPAPGGIGLGTTIRF